MMIDWCVLHDLSRLLEPRNVRNKWWTHVV